MLICESEAELRRRLRAWIYGADGDTLEGVAIEVMAVYDWQLAVVEANLGGRLIQRLAEARGPFIGGEVLTIAPDPNDLLEYRTSNLQVKTSPCRFRCDTATR